MPSPRVVFTNSRKPQLRVGLLVRVPVATLEPKEITEGKGIAALPQKLQDLLKRLVKEELVTVVRLIPNPDFFLETYLTLTLVDGPCNNESRLALLQKLAHIAHEFVGGPGISAEHSDDKIKLLEYWADALIAMCEG